MSTKDGAAVLLQGLTVLTMIREAHEAKRGEYILVRDGSLRVYESAPRARVLWRSTRSHAPGSSAWLERHCAKAEDDLHRRTIPALTPSLPLLSRFMPLLEVSACFSARCGSRLSVVCHSGSCHWIAQY